MHHGEVQLRYSTLSPVLKLCPVCHTTTETLLVTGDRCGGEAVGWLSQRNTASE